MKLYQPSLIFISVFFVAIYLLFDVNCRIFEALPGYGNCSKNDSVLHLIFIYVVSILLVVGMNRNAKTHLVLFHIIALHVIPILVATIFTEISKSYFELMIFIICIFLSMSLIKFTQGLNYKKYFFQRLSIKNYLITFLFLTIIFLALMYLYFGFSLSAPNISSVYETRENFKLLLESSGTRIAGYVILISGFAIAPFGVLLFLRYHNRYLCISLINLLASLVLCWMCYSVSGFKSVVFNILLTSIIYLYFKNKNVTVSTYFGLWLLLFGVGALSFILQVSDIMLIHWIRRSFITPAMNVLFYFDFYGYDSWGKGGIAPKEIMQVYYADSGSANAGLYGNAMAQYGLLGLIINPAILLIYMLTLEILGKGLDRVFIGAALTPFCYAISNSALSTGLISYGGFLILLLVVFSPINHEIDNYK